MATLVAATSRFFGWWFGELAGLLPAGWRSALGNRRRRLIVALSASEAAIWFGRRESLRDLGALPLGPGRGAAGRTTDAASLKPYLARAAEVVLLLPASAVLRRQVSLPLAASENLREVLGFEMDRHTPFKADEVYFDYRLVAKDAAGKRLSVDLVVATRAFVDGALEQLAAWGIAPDRLGVQGERAAGLEGFNLLPAAASGREDRRGSRLAWGLAVTACALLGVLVYLPVQQKQARLAEVEARLAGARAEAAAADELSQQVDRLIERGNYVVRQKRQDPVVAELLAELTRLLPDDTWIVQIGWSGERLTLAGYSGSSSALIALLEESHLLSNVRFNSPVTVDRRLELERFNLSAKVNAKETS